MASTSLDGTVRIWNLLSGACINTYQVHEGGATSVAMDWAHHRGLSAGRDEMLRIFDTESGELSALEGHSNAVMFAVADWEQLRALSISDDNYLKVWDLKSR